MNIGSGGWGILPPVVKNLLIINVLMFLATIVFQQSIGVDLNDMLGLHYPGAQKFEPYQLITYMFMHGSISHIFFNMFAVWMFGSAIENVWGSKRFLVYYLLTGLGAAALHYGILYFEISPVIAEMENIIVSPSYENIAAFVGHHEFMVHPQVFPDMWGQYEGFKQVMAQLSVSPNDPHILNEARFFFQDYLDHYKNVPNVVGASGSLFGILAAFGMMFPNVHLFMIFLPIPIKAKYFVIGYGVMEVIAGVQNNPGDNVAHYAHIGGMLLGFLIIKFWDKTGVRWR